MVPRGTLKSVSKMQESLWFHPEPTERVDRNKPTTLSGTLAAADQNANIGMRIPQLDSMGDFLSRITNLSTVLIPSNVALNTHRSTSYNNSENLAAKIVNAFNGSRSLEDNKYAMVATIVPMWGGIQLKVGEFLLAKRDEYPELTGYSPNKLVKSTWFFNRSTVEILGTYNLDTPFFGYGGTHVLIVPEGKIGLVTVDNRNFLYDEGVHVISAEKVNFDPRTGYVNKDKEIIHHGNIHVIRVPIGQIAKIVMEGNLRLIPTSDDPHTFISGDFKFEGFVAENDVVIEHRTLKRINLQVNQTAVISDNGEKKLLTYDEGLPVEYQSSTINVLAVFTADVQQIFVPRLPVKGDPWKRSMDNYNIYTSEDGLELFMRMQVMFKITDFNTLINRIINFTADCVEKHVDYMANQIALRCVRETKVRSSAIDLKAIDGSNPLSESIAKTAYTHIEFQISNNMKAELEKDGIEVIQMRFEIEPLTARHKLQLLEGNGQVSAFLKDKSISKSGFFGVNESKHGVTPSTSFSVLPKPSTNSPSSTPSSTVTGPIGEQVEGQVEHAKVRIR
jgi:hypothetical protein